MVGPPVQLPTIRAGAGIVGNCMSHVLFVEFWLQDQFRPSCAQGAGRVCCQHQMEGAMTRTSDDMDSDLGAQTEVVAGKDL